MRALERKLLRDLWNIKDQSLAIALVMAAGIPVFVMTFSTFESLRVTRKLLLRANPLRERFRSAQARPLATRVTD